MRDAQPHGPEGARYLATALWGEEVACHPMFAPLVAGDERIGLLVVCVPAPIPGADTALSAVAAHTAVTIKQHQLIERLQDTNVVKDLFRVLAGEEGRDDELEAMADRLGLDLRAEHLVLHVEPSGDARPAGRRRPVRLRPDTEHLRWHEVAGKVQSALDAGLGALFDHDDRSLQALITVTDRTPADVLTALRDMVWDDGKGVALSVGVSNVCSDRASFPQGFREAAAAAKVGALIRGKAGVTPYDELGPYRYALSVEGDDERDLFQRRLGLLVEYDQRRGTQLLDTLEGYLDHRGNVVGTSRALFIHPNTLRQRLDRIQRESGIDLEHEDWLSLAVATKVVKLGRMRGSATRERGNDG
jgi:sugar diacid utilization regulator